MDKEAFDKFVEKSYLNLLERVEECERRQLESGIRHANGIQWNGSERRDEALFSDKQVEWLEKFVRKEQKVIVGDAALRVTVLAIGAFVSGIIASALAFFGFKR